MITSLYINFIAAYSSLLKSIDILNRLKLYLFFKKFKTDIKICLFSFSIKARLHNKVQNLSLLNDKITNN